MTKTHFILLQVKRKVVTSEHRTRTFCSFQEDKDGKTKMDIDLSCFFF